MDQTQEHTPIHVDVVVVGAGLSGIQAAHRIQGAGISCVVVEATNRVGGKTFSVESRSSGPGRNDLGGAWINDTTQHEVYKLFQRFGLDGEYQRAEGNTLHEMGDGSVKSIPYGQSPLSRDDKEDLLRVMGHLQDLIEQSNQEFPYAGPGADDLDKQTFKQYCMKMSKGESGPEFADRVALDILGINGDEVSLLFMINFFKGATGLQNILSDQREGTQYMRIRQGAQSFANGLARELNPNSIYLSSPVTYIRQKQSSGCEVRCFPSTTFICKKVVVSVPTALYNTIHFDPELPPGKQLQAENATFGYYTKVIFVFDHPWWRENHLSGILTSAKGLISVTRDTSISVDNQWSITCFIVGERGKRWSKLSKGERYKQAWDAFRKAFETQVKNVPEPINTLEWEWSKQQYFWGAPTPVLGPGLLSRVGADLGAPFGNVHFVGSELAKMFKGFMEGALRSGQYGADQVVAEMGGTKAKRVHVL